MQTGNDFQLSSCFLWWTTHCRICLPISSLFNSNSGVLCKAVGKRSPRGYATWVALRAPRCS